MMRVHWGRMVMAAALLACGVPGAAAQAAPAGQSKTFDVASVRPSPPLDLAKLQADMQAGKMPNFGAHLDGLRAEYNYMSLKELIVYAYKVKPIQISGPDWLATQRFDIVARLPEGSTKDDAPAMLKALLEDRFKLRVHLANSDQPVFGLVVAKGGPKMKDSPELPAIDEDAPLKPGETKLDMPDGPARLVRDPKNPVAGTVYMGTRGSYTQSFDLKSQSLLIDGKGISMAGFTDLLNQVMQIGGSGARQVVDQTGLTGHYEVELRLSLADLTAAARAQGADIPGAPPPPTPGGPAEAADPGGGGSTIFQSVQALGLRLEATKASVQQLVVESMEKAPTEN
jgi:uncharacterized protein (TIGR03435 family)